MLSEEEILRTLDARGTLDSLPFMPEMLQFCGQRFRVAKRAHKACDTIDWGTMRRMEDAVHLVGVRCDGSAHGGCQAGCLIYWKDAWLRPVDGANRSAHNGDQAHAAADAGCTREAVLAATHPPDSGASDVFSCQATEIVRATKYEIPWWQVGQYVEDVRFGNAGPLEVFRGLLVGFVNKLQKASTRVLPRRLRIHDGKTYPFVLGKLVGATPKDVLNLQPGELVEVRSPDEIFETLNEKDSTRGLRFDAEMLRYCGKQGRVIRRVERIIDEKSGRLVPINTDAILVEGMVCQGVYHRSCPRASTRGGGNAGCAEWNERFLPNVGVMERLALSTTRRRPG